MRMYSGAMKIFMIVLICPSSIFLDKNTGYKMYDPKMDINYKAVSFS
jgi:hypothetical protein